MNSTILISKATSTISLSDQRDNYMTKRRPSSCDVPPAPGRSNSAHAFKGADPALKSQLESISVGVTVVEVESGSERNGYNVGIAIGNEVNVDIEFRIGIGIANETGRGQVTVPSQVRLRFCSACFAFVSVQRGAVSRAVARGAERLTTPLSQFARDK
ncbi:hypothetical protein EVAR_96052_1 [Eumeta japonica]|uniref:Uncharacterized protein n=1 Tax=Eumeta variegata TaxID=151549 RepID=A0A4C1WAC5_EUMVA|nr:hypothetical protein EVAR_96052_1 [Eumeta japonica]